MLCVVIVCIIFTVSSPPSSPLDSDTTVADVLGYDYYVNDRTPTIELPGKQSLSPLPDIAYLSVLFLH